MDRTPDGPVPEPDAAEGSEPDGFVVLVEGEDRIHFLDWGGPEGSDPSPGLLLVHGLAQTAWAWAPVARAVAALVPTVAMDLRGHGLSDAPTEGFDADTLADDVVAVAEGSGLLGAVGDRVVLAGHGLGAIVCAWAARALGDRCAGLVLVDGGWEELEAATELDVDEFLRGLDEPPEVLASLDAYLADRIGFDPDSWDADQDRAARAAVVETHAGRVVLVARPHVIEGAARAMFAYRPSVLAEVEAPVTAVLVVDDEEGGRAEALEDASAARVRAGRGPIRVVRMPALGHNVMRYRPADVAEVLLEVVRAGSGGA
jgi:pimeloyl-ACP methyl ester carboxylesterase